MDLASKHCVPCEGGVAPFTEQQAQPYLSATPGWSLGSDGTNIVRAFKFRNFNDALAFVNRVGAIAEEEGHHPDLELGWGRVHISLSTHAIKGLSENDFILAYKINQLAK